MSEHDFDAVIVGGGLAGVSTFYELVRRGQSVLLLDANDSVAEGASFANGGMLTASMPDPWNGPGVGKHLVSSLFNPKAAMKLHVRSIPDLTFWGLQFLRNSTPARHKRAILANYALADYSVAETRALGGGVLPAELLQASGALKIFEDEASFLAQKRNAELLGAQGLRHEELSPDQVVELEPHMEAAKGRILKGLFYPDDMSGDANAFCRSLAKTAQDMGGKLKTGVKVRRVQTENGHVVGAATSIGSVSTSHVIIAAGDASPDLANRLGIRLPIKPAKGYSVTFSVREWNARPSIPVIDDAMHAAVTPLGDKLRVVGTAEFAGRDKRLSQPRIDNLFDLFGRLYPNLEPNLDRSEAEAWMGFRPMSADGLPMIGSTKVDGLWINSGHGHLGWTMAMGSARLLGALMFNEKPPIDPTPYAPHRQWISE